MSEGPKVKGIRERPQRRLQGPLITDCRTTQENLRTFPESIKGRLLLLPTQTWLAQVHPRLPASQRRPGRAVKLAECIRHVMWESYRDGDRWTHRAYRRARMKCHECGRRIVMIRQGKPRQPMYLGPIGQIA